MKRHGKSHKLRELGLHHQSLHSLGNHHRKALNSRMAELLKSQAVRAKREALRLREVEEAKGEVHPLGQYGIKVPRSRAKKTVGKPKRVRRKVKYNPDARW